MVFVSSILTLQLKIYKYEDKILKKWQVICSVYHSFSANIIQPQK